MATWPTIQTPNVGTKEETVLAQVRTEFEGGYVQSRPLYTRGRDRLTLVWNALPEADYQTLRTFFIANQGDSFTWTHPLTATSMTMRFTGDSLSGRIDVPGYRVVELEIEEV